MTFACLENISLDKSPCLRGYMVFLVGVAYPWPSKMIFRCVFAYQNVSTQSANFTFVYNVVSEHHQIENEAFPIR